MNAVSTETSEGATGARSVARGLSQTAIVSVVMAVVFVVVLTIGLIVGIGLYAVGPAFALAAIAGSVLVLRSEQVVLRRVGAVAADTAGHARLVNVVDGLCTTAGLKRPNLYLIDDDARNALVTGRGPDSLSIAVTSGLLDAMDRLELEAVVAHLLALIKDDAVVGPTLAAVVRFGGPKPTGLDDDPHARADLHAVELTRYPPGLVSALEKVGAASSVVAADARASAHLWFAAPVAGQDPPTHPSLDERIASLRER